MAHVQLDAQRREEKRYAVVKASTEMQELAAYVLEGTLFNLRAANHCWTLLGRARFIATCALVAGERGLSRRVQSFARAEA
eukprot:2360651-Pleurochrysis_carterae.AAC.2